MNYVKQSNQSYTTTKDSLKRTPLSTEARERRDFIRNHKFTVAIDKSTLGCQVRYRQKEQE